MDQQSTSNAQEVIRLDGPRFIVVEGPIGVGKTSLARRLAESLAGELILEQAEENPFLERFYKNRRNAALPAQLFFLLQRARQLEQLRNDIAAGGPPPQGPGPNQDIDPIDGLPRGLPVVRGGGWDQSAPFQRVSTRFSYYGPTLRVSDIGFRVVREKVAPPQ